MRTVLVLAVFALSLGGCAAFDQWLYGTDTQPGAAPAIPATAGTLFGPVGAAVAASALGIYAMFRPKRKEP